MDTEPRVSVVIPVGPEWHHQKYLGQAVESVRDQTYRANEILLIDDMAGIVDTILEKDDYLMGIGTVRGGPLVSCRVWYAPWRMGVAQAFNCGVSLARNDLVFMLGSDDKLKPDCLERCVAAYRATDGADRYYWVGVEYSDKQEDQYLPCNAAMVTKGLWQKTGGFPPEASSGACDAAFLSQLIGNGMADLQYCVDHDKPLYWYRVNEMSDTAGRGSWQGVILETRDLLTAGWRQPTWGRFA